MTESLASYRCPPIGGDYSDALLFDADLPAWLAAVPDPGPLPYRLADVTDLGPLLPGEPETTFTTEPPRVEATDLPDALRELARQVEAALAHPAIREDCRYALVADLLRALADRVRPEGGARWPR